MCKEIDVTEFVMLLRHLHGRTGGIKYNEKKILVWIASVRGEIQRRDILIRKKPYLADHNIRLESWLFLWKACLALRRAAYE
jgi:hypothetical protein